MARHVDLLGILFQVAGALSGLVGAAALALGIGAAAIGRSGGVAAGVAAALFVAAGVVALVWGAASAWAGAALRRHQPLARTAGLLLAVLNLFVLPFGTALGAYGLWVLLHNDARRLFVPAE